MNSTELVGKQSERLSIVDAATRLGVSQKTVRRWIHGGKLPAEKETGPYGDQFWIPVHAVQTAQQVVDVVKVERPTDPRTLALAIAQAIETQQGALREELTRQNEALREELVALRSELQELRAELRANSVVETPRQHSWWHFFRR